MQKPVVLKLGLIFLLALPVALYFQLQTYSADPKPADAAAQPKPEDVLRRMADYLGKLPALSCRIAATLDVKEGDRELQQVTKMTARLARPNRLSLVVDEGKMGMTVVSDGKHLTQSLPAVRRYVVSDAPAELAQMTDVGVALKPTILGTTGALIPTSGEAFYKRLMSDVEASEYLGLEKVGDAICHHLRFSQKRFGWDIWIAEGAQPVVEKVVFDLSKPAKDEHVTIRYTVAFSDWNVSPKVDDSNFTFTPPTGAEQYYVLLPPDPLHPLVGQPAPAFKTVDENGHPFDLRQYLGKNVIMLEFWSSSCPGCVMSMPELDVVAKKFADRGVVYRAVNGGEDAATIKEFFAQTKFKVPVAMDPETEVSQAYGVQSIPQTVLIGKDGKVQFVHIGYSSALAGDVTGQIEALLAGKDLAKEELSKLEKANKKVAEK